MQGEAVACGAFLKYKQTNLLPHYIRRAPPLIWREVHILEKKKKGYTHSISF
jgi:hypothetical protein